MCAKFVQARMIAFCHASEVININFLHSQTKCPSASLGAKANRNTAMGGGICRRKAHREIDFVICERPVLPSERAVISKDEWELRHVADLR